MSAPTDVQEAPPRSPDLLVHADEGTARPRWAHAGAYLLRPLPLAVILGVTCLPFARPVPQATLDPSWQLAMSLVHARGYQAGPDWVFTYGPLGFLAAPDLVWLPGAVVGVVYALATVVALHFLVARSLRTWLAPATAAVLTALFALVCVRAGKPPELATTALCVWALTLVAPSQLKRPLSPWIVVALASASAVQLLVKFSAGIAAVLVVGVVVLSRVAPLRNVALWLASFPLALASVWVLSGQSLGNLARWIELSLHITLGYTDAMSIRPGWSGGEPWWSLAIIVGSLAAGLVVLVRTVRSDALPSVAVVLVASWIFVKAGFVRLDAAHVGLAFVALCALATALPWTTSWLRLGIVCVVTAMAATIVGLPAYPTNLRGELEAYAREPFRGLRQGASVARALVDPSRRAAHLAVAREEIRDYYRIPQPVLQQLRSRDVLVDPWDVSAAWAYDLRWEPVFTTQTYSGYTEKLDDRNAANLTARDGPNAILRMDQAIDARVAAWESPAYMTAMTCRFAVVAEAGGWQALHRHRDVCGEPRRLMTTRLEAGQEVTVPDAMRPGSIMMATFETGSSVVERLRAALLKPSRFSALYVNDEPRRFIEATASQPHLLKVPATIAGRAAVTGNLDVRTLALGTGQPGVTVTFWEIPTRAAG